MTSADKREPIWFNPPKFWAATKQMSREDAHELLNQVIFLAEIRDLEACAGLLLSASGLAAGVRSRSSSAH